jgi:hypothetical protein
MEKILTKAYTSGESYMGQEVLSSFTRNGNTQAGFVNLVLKSCS